jgi:hypothetical protein
MIKVYDDWLNPVVQSIFNETLTSSQIQWQQPSSKGTTVTHGLVEKLMSYDNKIVDSWQLVHSVVIDEIVISPLFSLSSYILTCFVRVLIDEINTTLIDPVVIERIKFNFQGQQEVHRKKTFYNPPHIDPIGKIKEGDHPIVAIYYAEDSDGDTFFFDTYGHDRKIIKRVSPKAGRVVIFDGDISHAGSPPQHSKSRIVANFNFYLPFRIDGKS